MEEVKRSTVSSLAGTVLFQVFLSSLFSFFFFYLFISFVPGDSASIVGSVLGVLFIFWVTGTSGNNTAEKDHNLIAYGHAKPFLLKGFVSGLLAQIPGIILLIVYFVFQQETFGVIYRLLYYFAIPLLNAELPNIAFYCLALIPFPLACGFGYLYGYQRAEKQSSLKLK